MIGRKTAAAMPACYPLYNPCYPLYNLIAFTLRVQISVSPRMSMQFILKCSIPNSSFSILQPALKKMKRIQSGTQSSPAFASFYCAFMLHSHRARKCAFKSPLSMNSPSKMRVSGFHVQNARFHAPLLKF